MRTDRALQSRTVFQISADGGWPGLNAPALDLGRPARDRLACGRRWTAIARFRRSMYLRGDNRDIVCLCSSTIDPGPLNVRCVLPATEDWRRLDLGADRTADIDGASLRFGNRIRFDFGGARIWKPVRVRGFRDTTSARLGALLDAAAGRAPGIGLGAIFRTARSRPVDGCSPASHGLFDAAIPALAALARWLEDACMRRQHRTVAPPREAIGLVGLGPGLTPSGDDYLGGVMVGLHAMNRDDLAAVLARFVLPVARRRTGAISHAHLACAAEGHGGAALHRTIAAIAGSGPLDVGPCLDAVARMGATSGWDALAGVALPISIYLGTEPPMPQAGN